MKLLAAAALGSWFLGTPTLEAQPSPSPADIAIAKSWLEAVARGDATLATSLAATLAPPSTWRIPDPQHAEFLQRYGLDPRFLNEPFGKWDVQAWAHALFFSKLARQITHGQPDPAPALFRAVTDRLSAPDPPDGGVVPLWPFRIWETGKGYCDRQAWVLCELAYQLGFDAKIVYLRRPDTLESPHTIAQLRHRGRSWVADPLSKIMRPDTSIAQVAADPAIARQLWPNNEDWQRSIVRPKLWVAGLPQDYCPRNQALQARLQKLIPDACPRFGEDPATRMRRVPEETPDLALWPYPVALLAYQMSRP